MGGCGSFANSSTRLPPSGAQQWGTAVGHSSTSAVLIPRQWKMPTCTNACSSSDQPAVAWAGTCALTAWAALQPCAQPCRAGGVEGRGSGQMEAVIRRQAGHPGRTRCWEGRHRWQRGECRQPTVCCVPSGALSPLCALHACHAARAHLSPQARRVLVCLLLCQLALYLFQAGQLVPLGLEAALQETEGTSGRRACEFSNGSSSSSSLLHAGHGAYGVETGEVGRIVIDSCSLVPMLIKPLLARSAAAKRAAS